MIDETDTPEDNALRPADFDEFIGQGRVRTQLQVMLQSAMMDERVPSHVLFSGGPGLGKTTLALIMSRALGTDLKLTSGPAIANQGNLASILMGLNEGDVLFIDEIHRMARAAEEMLLLAMEDYRIDIVTGKGSTGEALSIDLPKFTLAAATTRAGMLSDPLRARFGFTGHMEYYSTDEIVKILARSAGKLGLDAEPQALEALATCCRGTPRVANALLGNVRDYARVYDLPIDETLVNKALKLYEIDSKGLGRIDRAMLTTLLTTFSGGPVGIKTLAMSVSEESETIETTVEPYLVRLGMLARTPRGRIALPAAYEHMGIKRTA